MELPLLVAVALVACVVHGALGFGSGPVLTPSLALVLTPGATVVTAVLVGMLVNLLQLVTERRLPRLPALVPLWLAAPPGAAAGALVAGTLAPRAFALVLAAALLLAGALLLLAPERELRLGPAGLAAAGAGTGLAAALTGVFGPLLATLLTATGLRGDALRDAIGASFLLVGACAVIAALALAPGAAAGLPVAAALAPAAVAGQLLGRRVFRRLAPAGHRRGVLLTVLAGGSVALAGALGAA